MKSLEHSVLNMVHEVLHQHHDRRSNSETSAIFMEGTIDQF